MIESIGAYKGRSGIEWFPSLSVIKRVDSPLNDSCFVKWSGSIKGNVEGVGLAETVIFFAQFTDDQRFRVACRYNNGFYNAIYIQALVETTITAPKGKSTPKPREGKGTGVIKSGTEEAI